MKVIDIMKKDILFVNEETPLHEVALMMFSYRISGVPIVNDLDECIGIISEKDLIKKIFPSYAALFDVSSDTPLYTLDLQNIGKQAEDIRHFKAKDAMQREVVMVTPDTELSEAAAMLAVYHCRRLPVTENKKIIGIISQGDVFRALFGKELGLDPNK